MKTYNWVEIEKKSRELYESGLTMYQIANQLGINKTLFQRHWQKDFNIEIRSNKGKIWSEDIDTVRDLYLKQEWSLDDLAKKYEMSACAVNKFLKKHNIRKLELRDWNKIVPQIVELYINQNKRFNEVSEILGIDVSVMRRALQDRGIVKPYSLKHKLKEETWLKNLGTTNPSKNQKIKIKKAETSMKNFGVTSYMKLETVKEQRKQKDFEKYGKWRWQTNLVNVNIKSSKIEQEMIDFIKKIQPYTVFQNTRDVIGYEIDAFIANLNIGFEFNGCFWHDIKHELTPVYKKIKAAEKKNIKLYFVYENLWKHRNSSVKNIIKNLLCEANKFRIEDCKVVKIDNNTIKEIYQTHGLREFENSDNMINYALVLKRDDAILAVSSFVYKDNEWWWTNTCLCSYASVDKSVYILFKDQFFQDVETNIAKIKLYRDVPDFPNFKPDNAKFLYHSEFYISMDTSKLLTVEKSYNSVYDLKQEFKNKSVLRLPGFDVYLIIKGEKDEQNSGRLSN